MNHTIFYGLFTLAMFTSSATFAANLPDYDTGEYCAVLRSSKLMNISGLAPDCDKREQVAKVKLVTLWNGYDVTLRQHCARLGNLAGGSYAVVDDCVFDGLQIALLKQLLDMASGPKLKR